MLIFPEYKIKCKNCSLLMLPERDKCPHCGYVFSEEEKQENIDSEYSVRREYKSLGIIFAVLSIIILTVLLG